MKKMKKLVVMLLTLTMIMSMFSVAGAAASAPTIDNFGSSGWSSSWDADTKTITFDSGWVGRGWWFGSGDSALTGAENITIKTVDNTIGFQIVVQYEDDTTATAVCNSGTNEVTFADFDDTQGVKQIYLQNHAAGTLTLDSVEYNKDGVVVEKTLSNASFTNAGVSAEMSVGTTFTLSVDRAGMDLTKNLINIKILAVDDEGNQSWKSVYLESGDAELITSELESVGLSATVATVDGVTTFTFTCEEETATCGYASLTVKAEYCVDGLTSNAYGFTNTQYVWPDVTTFEVVNGVYKQVADNNVRFVQLISEEYAKNCSEVKYVLSYNGEEKATVTSNECYSKISAAGTTLIAPEGYVYVACAVTNVTDVSLVTCEISFTEIEQ